MNVVTRRHLEYMLTDVVASLDDSRTREERNNLLERVRNNLRWSIAACQQADALDLQAFVVSTQDY